MPAVLYKKINIIDHEIQAQLKWGIYSPLLEIYMCSEALAFSL